MQDPRIILPDPFGRRILIPQSIYISPKPEVELGGFTQKYTQRAFCAGRPTPEQMAANAMTAAKEMAKQSLQWSSFIGISRSTQTAPFIFTYARDPKTGMWSAVNSSVGVSSGVFTQEHLWNKTEKDFWIPYIKSRELLSPEEKEEAISEVCRALAHGWDSEKWKHFVVHKAKGVDTLVDDPWFKTEISRRWAKEIEESKEYTPEQKRKAIALVDKKIEEGQLEIEDEELK